MKKKGEQFVTPRDFVHDNIIVKAVNEKNIDNSDIYEKHGDIVLPFYLNVSMSELGFGSTITATVSRDLVNQIISALDFDSVYDLYDLAYENTLRLFPPKFFDMESIFGGELRHDDFMKENYELTDYAKAFKYAPITNASGTNGATSIFIPGVAARVAELFDDDLIIAFTSANEAMCHAANELIDSKSLGELANKTTKFLSTKDLIQVIGEMNDPSILGTAKFLSSKLLKYDRATDRFSVIEE